MHLNEHVAMKHNGKVFLLTGNEAKQVVRQGQAGEALDLSHYSEPLAQDAQMAMLLAGTRILKLDSSRRDSSYWELLHGWISMQTTNV